jgi:hypothetical protein
VIELLLAINKSSGPFVGVFAFRFVKASKATMAFTHFAPVTCVLELDGVQSKGTMRFYDAVWAEMDRQGISYTFHWGKMNILDAGRVRSIYGSSLDSFLAQRTKHVDADTLRIFSNNALRRYGIDSGAMPLAPASILYDLNKVYENTRTHRWNKLGVYHRLL